jgi:ketosteroid isomerase-like protein
MQRKLLIFLCAFLTVGVCRAASAQTCKTDAKDAAAVVRTMRTMYEAATVDDLAKLHTVVAPGFYAFDVGMRYESMDSLMEALKAYQDKGVKFVWNVTRPQVTVECDMAWITYVNDGSVQMPGASEATPAQWLESAIMKKQGGVWKLVFFHSTQVPTSTAK